MIDAERSDFIVIQTDLVATDPGFRKLRCLFSFTSPGTGVEAMNCSGKTPGSAVLGPLRSLWCSMHMASLLAIGKNVGGLHLLNKDYSS